MCERRVWVFRVLWRRRWCLTGGRPVVRSCLLERLHGCHWSTGSFFVFWCRQTQSCLNSLEMNFLTYFWIWPVAISQPKTGRIDKGDRPMLLTGLHTLHTSTGKVRSVATAHVRALGRAAYFGHDDQKSMQPLAGLCSCYGPRCILFILFGPVAQLFLWAVVTQQVLSPACGGMCASSSLSIFSKKYAKYAKCAIRLVVRT